LSTLYEICATMGIFVEDEETTYLSLFSFLLKEKDKELVAISSQSEFEELGREICFGQILSTFNI